MKPPEKRINVSLIARKVDVDNQIPLRNYYRIADNLLKQASIYREEKNIVDLYIMLLRFSSLVSETIPFHRDYQVLHLKERSLYKKKLLTVLDELESLKPEFQRRLNELNKAHAAAQHPPMNGLDVTSYGLGQSSLEWPSNRKTHTSLDSIWPVTRVPQSSWSHNPSSRPVISYNSLSMDKQFQKLSISLPRPKMETLSRHSFLGPNGLRGQWMGPSAEIKVNYPNSADIVPTEDFGLNQAARQDIVAVQEDDLQGNKPTMESVLSLDDGQWLRPSEETSPILTCEAVENDFPPAIIRQPSPPPVLAQVQPDYHPISPSRVADPRPGPAKPSLDGMPNSDSYQHLHIPVRLMEDFLRLACKNTAKNLETCGVLAGSLKNRVFHINMLIIPKQESTSDSCQTLNEEEIFEVQDKQSLFPLGWIHALTVDLNFTLQTHPSQTCFMSSIDLHTHYSYQVMLPEAIAIVMAPTDTASPHGIFHLSDPAGVSVIRKCQQRGFHPHEEPLDGNPIYEHCSHVYMNENSRFDIVDLR
ncbi:USP8 dimerization domain [Dillenia turbinata]|uniref:USP8 dimerization domain n=1 Tax=Dillenia turbinata TaxID=194707 RepID=A0AAN8Z9R0_9MAGN